MQSLDGGECVIYKHKDMVGFYEGPVLCLSSQHLELSATAFLHETPLFTFIATEHLKRTFTLHPLLDSLRQSRAG